MKSYVQVNLLRLGLAALVVLSTLVPSGASASSTAAQGLVDPLSYTLTAPVYVSGNEQQPTGDPQPQCVRIALDPPSDYQIYPEQFVNATIFTQSATYAQVVIVATGQPVSDLVPVFDHNQADVSFVVNPDTYYGVVASSGTAKTVNCTFKFPKRLPFCDSLVAKPKPAEGIVPGDSAQFNLKASDTAFYQVVRAADGVSVTPETTFVLEEIFVFSPTVNVDYAIKLRNVNGSTTGCHFKFVEYFGCAQLIIQPFGDHKVAVSAYGHGGTLDRWRLRDDHQSVGLPSGQGRKINFFLIFNDGDVYTLEWLDDNGIPEAKVCTYAPEPKPKFVFLPFVVSR